MSTVLRPTLVLGGASLAYQQSADPLILVVAMSQPDFGIRANSVWMDVLYYMTAAGCITRLGIMMRHQAEGFPLMMIEGAHLASHLIVDTGLISEDNQTLKWINLSLA